MRIELTSPLVFRLQALKKMYKDHHGWDVSNLTVLAIFCIIKEHERMLEVIGDESNEKDA